jgi:hypothetical protein
MFMQVSRKLVILESDVERSEDKAGHSQRFVLFFNFNSSPDFDLDWNNKKMARGLYMIFIF